jgi:hypothetical protein
MNSVRDAIGTLRNSIGAPVATALQTRIESTTYFLGGMDRDLAKIPSGFREQLRGLLETIQRAAVPPPPVAISPVYQVEGLEIALRDAVEGFQGPWQARLGLRYRDGIAKEHWTRIKALARRFANAWSNEYDDLRPVADLVLRLQENISKWLDNPADWTREPESDDAKTLALSAIRKAVFTALHVLVEHRLVVCRSTGVKGEDAFTLAKQLVRPRGIGDSCPIVSEREPCLRNLTISLGKFLATFSAPLDPLLPGFRFRGWQNHEGKWWWEVDSNLRYRDASG